MSVPKLVVHTDVFLEHLCGDNHPSMLRLALNRFFCYTTVFQAIELFSLSRSEKEQRAVQDSMAAMKIMGLNPKQAQRYGQMLSSAKRLATMHVLTAGLCLESKLPILTDRKRDFAGIKGLKIIPTALITKFESGQDILDAV